MEPEQLLDKIKNIMRAYADGRTAQVFLSLTSHEGERAQLQARVDYWRHQVRQAWDELTAAINSAMPPTLYAAPHPETPVSTPNDHQVEIRGVFGHRAVSIRVTPAQAAAIGPALVAIAAVLTHRVGGGLADILPPMPASPPGAPLAAA